LFLFEPARSLLVVVWPASSLAAFDSMRLRLRYDAAALHCTDDYIG